MLASHMLLTLTQMHDIYASSALNLQNGENNISLSVAKTLKKIVIFESTALIKLVDSAFHMNN